VGCGESYNLGDIRETLDLYILSSVSSSHHSRDSMLVAKLACK